MLKHDIIQLIRENYSHFYQQYDSDKDLAFDMPQKADKWSPGQHLEHIRKTTKAMNKALQIPRLVLWYKFGTTDRVEKSYDQLRERYTNATTDGFKSPLIFEPRIILNQEKYKLIARVRTEEEKLVTSISQSSESFLSKYLLPHAAFGKLTIREMLLFMAFHTDHHRLTIIKYGN